jgi:hypothetical protein
VESLDLSVNGIGDAGVAALAGANLAGLTTLDLRSNRLSPAAVDALLAAPHLGGLRRLGLSNSLPGLTNERWYDWDGSIAGGAFDYEAARALQARFPQHPEIF